MDLELNIPDSIVRAIRLPEKLMERELLKELAIALYCQEMLSFGKARELANMGLYEFGRLLAERKIDRHYGEEELKQDIAYALSE